MDWIMLSRAGAMIIDIVLGGEQARYPWKLLAVLRDEDLAEEVLEDFQICPSILDDLSRAHVAKYTSRSALLSAESMGGWAQWLP